MSQHPGAILRAAREAQHLDVDSVAQRLRLMSRQIHAIEEGDFASLGQPVFARGFVRNYARLLGLDAEQLVSAMQGDAEAATVQPAEAEAAPEAARTGWLVWLASPWVLLLALGALAVMALPIGLYFWLNSEGDEAPVAVAKPVPASRPAPRLAQAGAVPLALGAGPVAQPGAAAAAVPPVAAETPVAAPATGARSMEFSFLGDSWVEIREAGGHYVHRQLDPAGSSVVVSGKPPFDLVIGNAREVRMSYNGKPIDLAPFIEISVARFTLEE